ncbi:MAG TPA: Gfo/Idh/MocA family oxidoreductase [Bacteroidales bacterium]|nr:Gfo/Idh/MocA family oxidoreductase [Bacteroidales bacterium]
MKKEFNRRDFVKTAAIGGIGLGLTATASPLFGIGAQQQGKIGIIGLDTSHSIAFTKAINGPDAKPEFSGFRIVAAYPKGSSDIKSSYERIPGYIEEVEKYGVEITNSIDELILKVDYVLLETNDGKIHLEQALPVFRAGKRMFIDKPIAASLEHALAIFKAADIYKVPVFSSSSLRYMPGIKDVADGKIGKVTGADTFSPCSLEPSHPDLFWYGIHGVEALIAVMGTGCKTVTRVSTPDTDVVAGIWNDGRIGTFRGTRSGQHGYGGTAYGEKGSMSLGTYAGYDPLLIRILDFFKTGIEPVKREETIEIFTFMQAADVSKKKGGIPVEVETVRADAEKKAAKIKLT